MWAASPIARAVRWCESRDDYRIVGVHGGIAYYGGWQFALETWRGVGGPGIPSEQPAEVQDYYAWRLYLRAGWAPWECANRFD